MALLREAVAVNLSLAYEQLDMDQEAAESRRRRKKQKAPMEDSVHENVLEARVEREHLIALLKLVLSTQICSGNEADLQQGMIKSVVYCGVVKLLVFM